MSEEEKDLLARIGQLAGQINRHKNQHAGSASAPAASHSHHYTRHRAHPYYHGASRGRGRGARGGYSHQHRTLQLNNPTVASYGGSESGSGSSSPQWVTRNDRHRQLINADVYERDRQHRAKAIESTRAQEEKDWKKSEKQRFLAYLKRQEEASGAAANSPVSGAKNELVIQGIRFYVMPGGKKLVKAPDGANALATTPKTAVISGVKFFRTKTGSLIANRIVQEHRRSGVKKTSQRCKIFSSTGSCPKGPQCRFIHDPDRVALCKAMLKIGTCPNGDACDLSHEMTPERVPNCLHFAKGNCSKATCPFTHSKASSSAPVCNDFGFLGYCEKGADCTERHVFECPNFSTTGRCNIRGCKLLHRERASMLREQTRDDQVEDLSSDDNMVDSDDVDSDEVAEFIEADSDTSDIESHQDFIRV